MSEFPLTHLASHLFVVNGRSVGGSWSHWLAALLVALLLSTGSAAQAAGTADRELGQELLIGGSIGFVASYLACGVFGVVLATNSAQGQEAAPWFFIPVAGPVLGLSKLEEVAHTMTGIVWVEAGVQLAGVVLAGTGLALLLQDSAPAAPR